MADLDQALKTQLANIEKRTGRSLAELHAWICGTGLSKHGEIRDRLKKDLGMGHGDANTLVTIHLREATAAEGTGPAATPPGGMCQYKVRLSAPQEADAELEGWLRRAFDAAG